MAVARIVAQRPQQGGFQPLGAVPFHLVILGDAVGVAEIQLEGFAAQQIGLAAMAWAAPGPKVRNTSMARRGPISNWAR